MNPLTTVGVVLLLVGALAFLFISIFLGLIVIAIGLILIFYGRKATATTARRRGQDQMQTLRPS